MNSNPTYTNKNHFFSWASLHFVDNCVNRITWLLSYTNRMFSELLPCTTSQRKSGDCQDPVRIARHFSPTNTNINNFFPWTSLHFLDNCVNKITWSLSYPKRLFNELLPCTGSQCTFGLYKDPVRVAWKKPRYTNKHFYKHFFFLNCLTLSRQLYKQDHMTTPLSEEIVHDPPLTSQHPNISPIDVKTLWESSETKHLKVDPICLGWVFRNWAKVNLNWPRLSFLKNDPSQTMVTFQTTDRRSLWTCSEAKVGTNFNQNVLGLSFVTNKSICLSRSPIRAQN